MIFTIENKGYKWLLWKKKRENWMIIIINSILKFPTFFFSTSFYVDFSPLRCIVIWVIRIFISQIINDIAYLNCIQVLILEKSIYVYLYNFILDLWTFICLVPIFVLVLFGYTMHTCYLSTLLEQLYGNSLLISIFFCFYVSE